MSEQFQLPVIYQVDYSTTSFYFFCNGFVTDSRCLQHTFKILL